MAGHHQLWTILIKKNEKNNLLKDQVKKTLQLSITVGSIHSNPPQKRYEMLDSKMIPNALNRH